MGTIKKLKLLKKMMEIQIIERRITLILELALRRRKPNLRLPKSIIESRRRP